MADGTFGTEFLEKGDPRSSGGWLNYWWWSTHRNCTLDIGCLVCYQATPDREVCYVNVQRDCMR